MIPMYIGAISLAEDSNRESKAQFRPAKGGKGGRLHAAHRFVPLWRHFQGPRDHAASRFAKSTLTPSRPSPSMLKQQVQKQSIHR